MSRRLLLVSVLGCSLLAFAQKSQATTHNLDLKNSCEGVYDLAVVLEGNVDFSEFFNGGDCPPGTFQRLQVSRTPFSTVLHFDLFNGGQALAVGQIAHVGFTPTDPSKGKITDVYWTGEHGERLFGCPISITYLRIDDQKITFENPGREAIQVRDIRAATLSTPVPLALLNRCNGQLAGAWVSLSHDLTLAPGETVTIPFNPPKGSHTVVSYTAAAAGSFAEITDFAEVETPAQ
ncbi:MAG: hypothetical protein U0002_13360 [Thermoanaerobaculia bacterium]